MSHGCRSDWLRIESPLRVMAMSSMSAFLEHLIGVMFQTIRHYRAKKSAESCDSCLIFSM